MNENDTRMFICDLLDCLKASVRWMESIESIFNAIGITCKAIEPDPLMEFNLHILFCHLDDPDLVAWWLNADDDDDLYIDPRTGEEFEIIDAADLYDLVQKRRRNMR